MEQTGQNMEFNEIKTAGREPAQSTFDQIKSTVADKLYLAATNLHQTAERRSAKRSFQLWPPRCGLAGKFSKLC